MTPEDKYPALMAYIKERSSKDEKAAWNRRYIESRDGGESVTAPSTSRSCKPLPRTLRPNPH
jgi:hypothetical protein